jgi:hypothetical protein
MPARRALFDLVARAIAEPASPSVRAELPRVPAADVVALAGHHRVAGQLGPAFEAAGLPIPDGVVDVRRRTMVGHLQKLQALRRVTTVLEHAGIAALVVKGPVLASAWYGDPAARTYHDLDLLVAPVAFGAAIETLGGAGFTERNRNWSGYRALGMGEVPLEDGTVALDLHWHLVTFASDRSSFGFHTEDLLDRRVPIELGPVVAHRLDDDDTVAHTVLHAGLAGARLLIHQRDVQVVTARVEHRAAVRRMKELGVGRLGSATLARVGHTLGGDEALPRALGAPLWRTVNAAVDAVWARAVPGATNAFPSALLSSGRPTATATTRAFGVQLARAAGRRLGVRTFTSPGGRLDVDLDAGGRPERDRFVADVERGEFGR